MKASTDFVFAITVVENDDETRSLLATICYADPDDDGVLRRPRWAGYRMQDYDGRQFADFAVSAYLGAPDRPPFSAQHYFTPNRVELPQAESIVKTLRKLRRGLDKIQAEEGHLADSDFTGYVFRIARVLGIGAFYVRTTRKRRELTGQWWDPVDTAAVQDWIKDRIEDQGAPL